MNAMKHRAIVCNIGHFDSEIEIAKIKKHKWVEIKPQVHEVIWPDGKCAHRARRGAPASTSVAPPVTRAS